MKTPTTVSTKRAFSMYVLVSLFLFFEMALQVSPSVMSSQLMHALDIGTLGLGIMSGCYFYTYTAMQIPSGALFDRFNSRVIITSSVVVCACGALIFSFAHHIGLAILARLLMGTGSAFAFVSVLVVTSDLFRSKHFATLTGVTQMLAAFGAMSGQMPINYVVVIFGWRNALLLFASIGFVIAIAVFVFLRYPNQSKTPIQKTHKNDFKGLFARSQTWKVAGYACLSWMPMSGFASLWGVPFLKTYEHLSTNQAAFLCSLMWLGLALASPIVGAWSTHMRNRKIPLFVTAFVGFVAFFCLLIKPWHPLFIGLFVVCSGAACSGQALSFTVVKENNPKQLRATALALNNMAVVISGAVVQPLIGWIIAFLSPQVSAKYHFQIALLLILLAYVGAAVLAGFCIQETYPSSTEAP